MGLQQYFLTKNDKDLDGHILKDITLDSPLSAFLTLSKAGLCAYFGITELTNISEGDNILVTGASGCVGSLVPQIIKAHLKDKHEPEPESKHPSKPWELVPKEEEPSLPVERPQSMEPYTPNVRICGLSSSDKKCELMKTKLKYDEAINYRKSELGDSYPMTPGSCGGSCLAPTWSTMSPFPSSPVLFGPAVDHERPSDAIDHDLLHRQLKELFPKGVDLVFDKVGGPQLDICLHHINKNARIIVCGAICPGAASGADVSPANHPFGPPYSYINLILKSARMEGFILDKYENKFREASQTLVRWIQEHQLDDFQEHVIECSLENQKEVANALIQLFIGDYLGKLIIRVKQ